VNGPGAVLGYRLKAMLYFTNISMFPLNVLRFTSNMVGTQQHNSTWQILVGYKLSCIEITYQINGYKICLHCFSFVKRREDKTRQEKTRLLMLLDDMPVNKSL